MKWPKISSEFYAPKPRMDALLSGEVDDSKIFEEISNDPRFKIHNSCGSKTLILIVTHKHNDGIVESFWPYLESAECDFIFTSPEAHPSKFGGIIYGSIFDPPSTTWHLQHRMLVSWKFIYDRLGKYEDVLCTQWDSLFFGRPERVSHTGLESQLVSMGDQTLHHPEKPCYFHPPWWFDTESIKNFVDLSFAYPHNHMKGVMDRWIGDIMMNSDIPWRQSPISHYAQFWIGITEGAMEVARQAARAGAIFFHGVKTLQELSEVQKAHPVKIA